MRRTFVPSLDTHRVTCRSGLRDFLASLVDTPSDAEFIIHFLLSHQEHVHVSRQADAQRIHVD